MFLKSITYVQETNSESGVFCGHMYMKKIHGTIILKYMENTCTFCRKLFCATYMKQWLPFHDQSVVLVPLRKKSCKSNASQKTKMFRQKFLSLQSLEKQILLYLCKVKLYKEANLSPFFKEPLDKIISRPRDLNSIKEYNTQSKQTELHF